MQKLLIFIALYGIVPYVAKQLGKNLPAASIRQQLGKTLMSLPRPAMMILMALPEQYVMLKFHPNMSLLKRLSVSLAMYVVNFAWNGMVMKPKYSYNELVWILGTGLFGYQVLGVGLKTAVALVAADSVMTLSLRGLA